MLVNVSFTILMSLCSGASIIYHALNEKPSTERNNVDVHNLVPVCAKTLADLSNIYRSNKGLWHT
jgi:hypothetical protein